MKNRTKSILFGFLSIAFLLTSFTMEEIGGTLVGIAISIGLGYYAYIYFNKKDEPVERKTIKQVDPEETRVPSYVYGFEIKTWGNYLENIKKWQQENARDQWLNKEATEKPTYHYSWESDIPAKFIFESNNPTDPYAILVSIDDIIMGYVPRGINIQYRQYFNNNHVVLADVHGGERRVKLPSGEIEIDKFDPIVNIKIYM